MDIKLNDNPALTIPHSIFEIESKSKIVTFISTDTSNIKLVKTFFESQFINQKPISEKNHKTPTVIVLNFNAFGLNDAMLQFFAESSQNQYDLIQKNLEQNVLGLILLVTGNQSSVLPQAKHVLEFMTSQADIPFLVGVTQQRPETQSTWKPADIADYFELPHAQVLPFDTCKATASLNGMIDLLEHQTAHRIETLC